MQISHFRGIFLTSERPAQTAEFYREVARLDWETIGEPGAYQYQKLDQNGIQLAIHDARFFATYTHPNLANSNNAHLYFKIASQEEFLAHLAQLGIAPFAIDDVVVTVEDPDGRKVMFGTA